MKTKSVTLDDVAHYAGVSYQTVSRVLNQAPNVSDKTRAKIEQAMIALHYVPNRVAQQLAGKNSCTLGLVTTNLSLHAPSQIASAIKIKARQLGFSVVIAMIDHFDEQACQRAVNELLAQRVEGILINAPLTQQQSAEITHQCTKVPVIFLDVDPQSTAHSVVFDPFQGARQGAEHLLALGHQKIILIAGPKDTISSQLRYQGWLTTLALSGLKPQKVFYGDWSAHSGYLCAKSLLQSGTSFTAILVASDQMALGVLRALQEQGLSIPKDVSIVGYDDTDDSAYFHPPLTTVRQDFRQLGEKSLQQLVARLRTNHDTQPNALLLSPELVLRQTTAPVNNVPIMSRATPQELAEQLVQIANRLGTL
ncbi:LacI family DNA-binding transcriptional regulator [Yersinia nurmii]|uniref:LacI family DNA-binding transcriptional regulator n=1 Tax=Yersinia nurmii TaxID=685706 RepID=A0AAW7K8P3_9GAMM|nr:LacI family DNA-binding transcriptional regulator [Yersinia nurmii]MDN0089397.1 LacI family DNA-binding transcriptional regulator [Yersinia nurmii]